MNTNRICVLATIAALLLIGGSVGAQEQTYSLAYKFVPGRTDVTQMTMTGTLPLQMTPGPEANIPPMGFDVSLNMNMTMSQLCSAVDAKGTAQLQTTIPMMATHTSMDVVNQKVDTLFKWENGQIEMSVNGTAQPPDENLKKLAGILGATLRMTMTPGGQTTADAETQKLLMSMMNANGGMTADLNRLNALTSQLPDHPVKVGDTWKVSDTGKLGDATLSGSSDLKLAAIETFEGARTARIEGEARLSIAGQMPATGGMGMPARVNITRSDIAIAFVNHFDLDRGLVLVSTMNLNQNMAMMISMGEGNQAVVLPATIENAQMTMETRHQ